MKYNKTGLSPLSKPFWPTIKQLKWITIPIKPQIFKYECKYKSQFTVRPNKHNSLTYY